MLETDEDGGDEGKSDTYAGKMRLEYAGRAQRDPPTWLWERSRVSGVESSRRA